MVPMIQKQYKTIMQRDTKKGSVHIYKEKIIELVGEIENPIILKLIYGFAKSGYNEEKAGRK